MIQKITKRLAVVLAMVMLLTSFAFALPVNADTQPDLKKANVKWDLKNNKTLKFKTKWAGLGVKQHTVKMTNFKVKNSAQPGFKECTFTLTFNRKINPNKKQMKKMLTRLDTYGSFGGDFYYAVVDYQTGQNLEVANDKNVTVESQWKFLKKTTKKSKAGYIWYTKKNKATVKITYPATYTNLAIGVGGHSSLKIMDAFWDGEIPYSQAKGLYSAKNKSYAHFMRVNK